ncbi:MAG: GNAT family N-acetyltransferase, partial [Clostridiales bacterium]|nr:GNAT family N-acetyltransferase [Clostridiales bacterium]
MRESTDLRLVNMQELREKQREQAATILSKEIPKGWKDTKAALAEIEERSIPENFLLALLEGEDVVGWGGILAPMYDGRVYEVHPLVVTKNRQLRGYGTM